MEKEKSKMNSLEVIEMVGKGAVDLNEGEALVAVLVTQEGKILLAGKADPAVLSGIGNYMIERAVIQRLKEQL